MGHASMGHASMGVWEYGSMGLNNSISKLIINKKDQVLDL
jgi:hypothetical protein